VSGTPGRRFEGRAILVTGSTGIAGAAASAIAAEGGRVFVVSRTSDHARALAEGISASGGSAGWRAADLAEERDAEAAVGAAAAWAGRIDGVYHVAGISARRYGDGPLHDMTLEGWETAMAVNARSAFLVARAAVRRMLAQDPDAAGRRGAVLLMSSVLAWEPSPRHFGTHGYAASKGAIEALMRSASAWYAPHGIRLNAIAPALTATPMSERAQRDEAVLAVARARMPLSGGPIDVADLVGTALWLLSDDARIVTGQVVTVDGGWSVSEG
jgi:NAD(P)-dependent dehydrogenase (short-subunit alcohol dehydrogenase family)